MWEKLDAPMEVAKLKDPAQCMKFLGIEFDTVSGSQLTNYNV